jgi:two-component system, OmpR family, sensor kinase
VQLECSPTDLSALARETARMAQVNAPDRSIVVNAPKPTTALVDQPRMGQVLMNLLDNAIKFSPSDGRIEVEVGSEPEHYVRLAVRDYGPGIAPEDRAHVFDRFYQSGRRGGSFGLGLGLYISQQIVSLHGGQIGVEAPGDGGTRFVVTLPASCAESSG